MPKETDEKKITPAKRSGRAASRKIPIRIKAKDELTWEQLCQLFPPEKSVGNDKNKDSGGKSPPKKCDEK